MCVIVEKREDYDYEALRPKVFAVLDRLGAREMIGPGKRVFLKANLLSRKSPEEAVTTHPHVVRAAAEYVVSLGAQAIIGDSPGGLLTEAILKGVYQTTGMQEAALASGASLNYDIRAEEIKLEEHFALERIEMLKAVLEADVLINIAKLKTHVMMTYTGAVKNLYGTIPGLTKAAYHMKLQEPQPFANHLLDICEKLKPCLNIIDGITAMEGDGPSNGERRDFGYLLGGNSAYELDYVACMLAGIETAQVACHVEALKRNLLVPEQIKVEWNGEHLSFPAFRERLSALSLQPFKRPRPMSVNFLHGRIPAFLEKFLVRQTKSKPVFMADKCIGCGKCVRSCPAQIISLREKKAEADLQSCISCFCCHELCPADAIRIKVPLAARLLFGEGRKR